jgi:hypothetical protein
MAAIPLDDMLTTPRTESAHAGDEAGNSDIDQAEGDSSFVRTTSFWTAVTDVKYQAHATKINSPAIA